MIVTPGTNFSELAEGKARGPHFFAGVATIVTKVCILWWCIFLLFSGRLCHWSALQYNSAVPGLRRVCELVTVAVHVCVWLSGPDKAT